MTETNGTLSYSGSYVPRILDTAYPAYHRQRSLLLRQIDGRMEDLFRRLSQLPPRENRGLTRNRGDIDRRR